MIWFVYIVFGVVSGLIGDFLFKSAANIVFEGLRPDVTLVIVIAILVAIALMIYDLASKTSLPSTVRELEDAKRQINGLKEEIEYQENALKARNENLQTLRDALERANARPVETERIAQEVGNTLVGNRLDEIVAKATKLRDVYDRSCQLQTENERLKESGAKNDEYVEEAKELVKKLQAEIEKLRHTVVEQRRMQHFLEEAAINNGFAPGELRHAAKSLRAEHEGTAKPMTSSSAPRKGFVPSRPRR